MDTTGDCSFLAKYIINKGLWRESYRHNLNPMPRQWVHILSNIDPIERTGICEHCGPVKLKTRGTSYFPTQPGYWKCENSSVGGKTKRACRLEFRTNLKEYCERCLFKPAHHSQLDIHHKDYNHKNNDPSNLETLCANCHRLETWMKRNPGWKIEDGPEFIRREGAFYKIGNNVIYTLTGQRATASKFRKQVAS